MEDTKVRLHESVASLHERVKTIEKTSARHDEKIGEIADNQLALDRSFERFSVEVRSEIAGVKNAVQELRAEFKDTGQTNRRQAWLAFAILSPAILSASKDSPELLGKLFSAILKVLGG